MEFTDKLISELIKSEKRIVQAPLRELKEDRGCLKNNFTLESLSDKNQFKVFIRVNSSFKENFSVGMDFSPRDEKGSYCLIRCNGRHGEHQLFPHHQFFHVHIAKAEYINSGIRPEFFIEETDQYASYEEALHYFLQKINLNQVERDRYFPLPQLGLFD